MKWRERRGSRNIEDRRGKSRRGTRVGRASGMSGLGLIAVLLIGAYFGVDVTPLLQGQSGGTETSSSVEISQADRQAGQFVSVVLADTEEIWAGIFGNQVNGAYQPATLVLFKTATQSPCGGANGATGPFYCPSDQKIYLDTGFFTTLSRRLGAGGDFAQAYVVAHEVAHHVQNQLGILAKTTQARQRVGKVESNKISVRIELQADCYSGIWARNAERQLGTIEKGDIAEAINAARQIGDDTLQRNSGQRPMPHTFTHGTSKQRQHWFSTGYQTGNMAACDTFVTDAL